MIYFYLFFAFSKMNLTETEKGRYLTKEIFENISQLYKFLVFFPKNIPSFHLKFMTVDLFYHLDSEESTNNNNV